MKTMFKKILLSVIVIAALSAVGAAVFTIFFDQAVFVRRGTIYQGTGKEKLVALTFDDGPSPEWTPKILDELKKADIKATFFMLGEHVALYPDIAKRVAAEGHEIGNHTYDHHVLLYYKTEELEKELNDAQAVITRVIGKPTVYFRPPKGWLTDDEKKKINAMGYTIILWTLNSKDWVHFDEKYIISYILRYIQPGDILLFHDSGGAFSASGGNRKETVKTIAGLAKKLRERGYRFVTITQLLEGTGQ